MNVVRATATNSLLIMTAIAVLFAASPLAAADSQYVVLSAEPAAADLPPGKLFAPSDVINVPAGIVVTLLGEDGNVNTIAGPGAFVVTEDAPITDNRQGALAAHEAPSKLALIAGLLANERRKTESIGGSRTSADQSHTGESDNPWAVSIEQSGPGCIRNGEVLLSRKEIGRRAVFALRIGNAEPLNDLIWSAGDTTYLLPNPLPANVKVLTVETSKTSALIEIHTLPPAVRLDNPLDVLSWMASAGCERQALALVRQLAKTKR
ncbi:hypothetical protein [Mesorhizobium sp.]|uniref:hypothetical protein n=1 Tax=Mesorhizobium sp. TaxID=1871066 RepID=UPI000FE86EE0|nr:hypothetical protein [Mesorhizobium sp.]RWF28648.1 MAG: hypothetical protein EOS45_21595 [Mesorhizobium sp.]